MTNYNSKNTIIVDKTPDVANVAANTALNVRISEVKVKIPSINSLAMNATLTAIEDEIANIIDVVKKLEYDNQKIEII